jgi:mannose-6-phosphate isomerase-like protein (cupin superfamily)
MKIAVLLAALACFCIPALWPQNQANQLVWAPKPVVLSEWTAPNKPHWKYSEILAAHKGQASWRQPVVNDDFLRADYIQMAPGEKTPRRAHPDTREWWIVRQGQIRFSIDGQEPFVASSGYMVQVPYRTFYSMETVGEKPSLRLEVNIANARTMYPGDEKPPALDGYKFVKTTVAGKGGYTEGNKPWIDFSAVVAGTEKQRRFIADDRAVANIIIGEEKNLPKMTATDKGHFHGECAEFWLIMLGNISYRIEGLPDFVADVGDIVYVPRGRWHLARFSGDKPSCRLAMNGFQDIGHFFEPKD